MEMAQIISTIVQAVSAVAVAILTWRLIGITSWYAKTTADYATTAERQYKEMVQAREASFQPYIHVVNQFLEPSADWYIDVDLTNLGAGSALNVSGCLYTQAGSLERNSYQKTVLLPGGDSTRLGVSIFPGDYPSDPAAFFGEATLKVEYRDILGYWWITEVPVLIGRREDIPSRVLMSVLTTKERGHRIDTPSMHRQPEYEPSDGIIILKW